MKKRPNGRLRGDSDRFDPDSARRIQERAGILADQLRACSKTDLEMLIRFYLRSEDEHSIAASMKVDPRRLRELRSRMRGALQGPNARVRAAGAAGE